MCQDCFLGLELIFSTLLLTVIFNIFDIWGEKDAFAKDNLLEWKSLSAGEYMNRVKIDLHFTLITLLLYCL